MRIKIRKLLLSKSTKATVWSQDGTSDASQIRCKPRLKQTNKQTNKQHLKEDLSQPLFSEYHVSQKAFNKAAEVNKHHFAYLIELV